MARSSDFEDAAAQGLATLLVWAVILASIAAATLMIVTLKEIGRIYLARAFQPTAGARILWIALAGQIGVGLVAGVLATNPVTLPLAAYLSSWSFLLFVVIVEGVDLYQKRFDPPELPAGDNLDEYLGTFAASPNGEALAAVGMK